jgi:hypothetical protein
MNYTELTALVKEYLEVDEATFNANIDQFVKQAEEEIYRAVQLKDLRKNSTASLVDGSQYLGLPSDYLSSYSLAVSNAGEYSYLLHKDVNFIREAYPNATTEGLPKFYAEFDDDTIILGPTPDSAYTVELHYYYRPTSIVDANTSWVGTNAENALLFGTLLQAYIFLKGDQDVMAMYQAKYDTAIRDLTILQEGRNAKDTYRKPNRRMDI